MRRTRYTVLGTAVSLVIFVVSQFEGKSNKAYLDLVEVPTICYGYTRDVKIGETRTDTECLALLKREVDRVDSVVSNAVRIDLTDNQRAAIISWAYNVGDGNFYRSTLLKELNRGNIVAACNQLSRWVYAKGQRINGFVQRREQERKLCLSNE